MLDADADFRRVTPLNYAWLLLETESHYIDLPDREQIAYILKPAQLWTRWRYLTMYRFRSNRQRDGCLSFGPFLALFKSPV